MYGQIFRTQQKTQISRILKAKLQIHASLGSREQTGLFQENDHWIIMMMSHITYDHWN